MEAVALVLVPVVRGLVQRPVLAVVVTTARAPVVARAAELAADARVLALARVPLPAKAVAATIAPVLVATLALGPVKTLPPPHAHHVATAATAHAAVVAQAAVVAAAQRPVAEPLKAVEVIVILARLHVISSVVQDVVKDAR